MPKPAYSSVAACGSRCGNKRAWTGRGICSSNAARRSASGFSAGGRGGAWVGGGARRERACAAALSLALLAAGAALCLDRPAHHVETHELERVAVDVLKTCEHRAPDGISLFARRLRARRVASAGFVADAPKAWRAAETNAPRAPLVELRRKVLRHEHDGYRAADFLVVVRPRTRRDGRESRAAVGRRDRHPTLAGLETGVIGEPEPELVDVEAHAPFLIADEHLDRVQA